MGRALTSTSDTNSTSYSSSAESSFREHDDVFLQTQTRIWLGEVLQTRLDDQVELSELLADGELLFDVSKLVWNMLLVKCKELRHVKEPKCNPIGYRKSIGRYRPYSNVDSFLKICKILGLNSVDLFSPSDVVEKRDTRKVCICIRFLSKKARTKQLRVPDFGIVTYTITMPTVMVGGLRKSLESPKCSSKSSAQYTPCRYSKSKSKSWQEIQDRFCNGNNRVCPIESDNTESNCMGKLTYSSSKSNSCDNLKGMDDSPEVSSALRISEVDNLDFEMSGQGIRHSGSSCSEDKSRSFCSEYGDSSSVVNSISSPSFTYHSSLFSRDIDIGNGSRNHEGDFPDDASFVGDSQDDMVERLYISPQFAFPDITLGLDNGSVLFDGEDDIYNLLMGFERSSTDDFDDVEVSSMSSMSSVFGRVLNLNFDEQFDVSDLGHKIQEIDDYENSEHSFTNDSENQQRMGNSDFYNELSSSRTGSQSYAVENKHRASSLKNDFVVSERNLIKEMRLENEEQKMDNPCVNEGLVVPCNSSIGGENFEELHCLNGGLKVETTEQCSKPICKFDRSFLKHEGMCFTELMSKDASTFPDVEDLAEFTDMNEDKEKKPSNIKFHKRKILGTVFKGTAVFGAMAFLLHLRNRIGNKDGSERGNRPPDSQHVNGTRNTRKAQERGRENGVYPADKFKFRN